MEPYPKLQTARLILHEFSLEDAPNVQRLVGEWEVASTLLRVPHPYEEGFGSVGFVFDLPTSQRATFSTSWPLPCTRVNFKL